MSTYDTTPKEGTDTELTDFDGRPAECDCAGLGDDLPCFACYLEGFEELNPNLD